VVVVGGGQVPRVIPSVVVVAVMTCHRAEVVMLMLVVKGKMMICIQTRFLGLTLDPGRTQGYI